MSRPPLILAIDQGTTGTTCLVVEVGEQVQVLGRGYHELPQHFPQPGWVEHDLAEIWASVGHSAAQALARACVGRDAVHAIGLTNQRETVCLWYLDGRPASRAVVWQDRRTASLCRRLSDLGHEEGVRRRTGLVLDPYFSGSKILWLVQNDPELKAALAAGRVRVGTVDSWLLACLTGHQGAHLTDVTNAARTMLFDIHQLSWDPELCALFGNLSPRVLPEVRGNAGDFGRTRDVGFIADDVPICGVAGDQCAALFGQACLTTGMAKCTYGTGAFALVNTGQQVVASARGLISTIAWRHQERTVYALEGSIFVAGAIVQWLRDGLGLIQHSHEIEALARQVPNSGGVTLVPALTGLGAPHWRPEARGLLRGLTRGTTRAHIARAALEGIALQVLDLLESMRLELSGALQGMRVDGGASANNMLMQLQADLLGIAIQRPQMVESTALGAAYWAALGAGIFTSTEDVARSWRLEETFVPCEDRTHLRDVLTLWQQAVASA